VTPWWQGRMVGFDVETTGTDVESDRIVSAAVCKVGGGEPEDSMSLLVDPGVEIPEAASAVHGITTAQVVADGLEPEKVLRSIHYAMAQAVGQGWPVVAFNARFDLTMLDRECRRYGITPPEGLFVVDPMVIDKHLDRFRKGRRTLAAICEAYGVDLPADEAHTAGADALAACRAAWVLGAKGEVKRRVRSPDEGRELATLKVSWSFARDNLELLHLAQQRWAAEQARSLRDYFTQKGQHEDAASVSEHWPVVPFKAPAAVVDE
jgi:DNA polymerase-3 subunit epsilon